MLRQNSYYYSEDYIMQKLTLLVLTALIAVASATISEEEKKATSKWDIKMPYISKKYGSGRIAIGTSPDTKSKKKLPVSNTQATSPVSKKEDITQVPATNADVPKQKVKPSLRVEIPQYIIPTENPPVSNTQITPKVPKTEDISPIHTPNVDIPKKEAGASVPETQVLVLKVTESKDQLLIAEWKKGQNLDWSFNSLDNDVYGEVKAHKSVILKYSSYLQNICKIYANNDARKNSFPFYYPSRIIESLVTLLYEHSVTINKSDYDSIMAGAKVLQIDQLIGIL